MRLAALLLLVLLPAQAALGAGGLAHEDVAITTAAGQTYHFDVEVAASPQEQERGLMFRGHMAADAGMIFPYDRDTTATFWMHNTLISLDMLFIDGSAHISHIAADAVPQSDALIPSGGPIRSVLELNAGTAARLGIHVGDKVAVSAPADSGK